MARPCPPCRDGAALYVDPVILVLATAAAVMTVVAALLAAGLRGPGTAIPERAAGSRGAPRPATRQTGRASCCPTTRSGARVAIAASPPVRPPKG